MPPAASASRPTRRERVQHRSVGGLVVEQRDVVAHGAGEQLDLLGHQRNTATQLGQWDLHDRNTAELDPPAGWFHQTQHQSREGGLAASRAFDDSHGASCSDAHVDVTQHRSVIAVVEIDVIGDDRQRPLGRARGTLVEHLGLDGEQVGHTHHGTVGLLHRLELVDHLFERASDEQHELEQQECGAECDRAGADQCSTEHQGQHPASSDGALHEPPHHQERPLAPYRTHRARFAVFHESPRDMVGSTIGTKVLGCGEPLFDPAEQPPSAPISSDDSDTARCRWRRMIASAIAT